MQFELDRADDPAGEPSIAEMTEKAIEILSKNKKGYFLMVEGIEKNFCLPSSPFNHPPQFCSRSREIISNFIVVQNKDKFWAPTDVPRNLFCITGNIDLPLCFVVIACYRSNSLNISKFG